MNRRLLLLILMCVALPNVSHAGLLINEVMYDASGTDADHEWIEIYNDGSSSSSLLGLKFNDGANHGLNTPPTNGSVGSLTIPAGGYAILSGSASTFKSDYPDYEGTVIDTVMSLTNSGDTISLVDQEGSVVDSFTYSSALGAAGDGNTLSVFGSEIAPAVPTPGKTNVRSTGTDTPPVVDTSSEGDAVSVDTVLEEVPHYSGAMVVHEPFTKNVPIFFDSLIIDPSRKINVPGKYEWSMGDGGFVSYEGGHAFGYTYTYSGDYNVVLDYFHTPGTFTPDVHLEKQIHVGESNVVLGSISAGSVEIKNLDSKNVNLSGWSIESGNGIFVFPKNTILLGDKSIYVPSSVSKLSVGEGSRVTLIHASGSMVSDTHYAVMPSHVPYVSKKVDRSVASAPISMKNENKLIESTIQPESIKGDNAEVVSHSLPEDVTGGDSINDALGASVASSGSGNAHGIVYVGVVLLVVCAVIVARRIDRFDDATYSKKDEYDVDEFTIVE